MTSQIFLTLTILLIAILLFISEKLSADLIALLVLAALALIGLVSPEEAISGFSNPAVVTIWAMFILSAGLTRTGVAGWLGRQVLRLGGNGKFRLIFVITLATAVLSAFMNNVGVVALMLPVVLDISRRTKQASSQLLMPLAFASLLGGMTTLIGTPANILVNETLVDSGYQAFGVFDFFAFGGILSISGLIYLVFFSRFLLPDRDKVLPDSDDIQETFAIEDRLFVVCLPGDSPLANKTLGKSHLGSALGLNVIGIIRDGHTSLAPDVNTILQGGDRLLVTGRPDRLYEVANGQGLNLEARDISIESLLEDGFEMVEVRLPTESKLIGETLEEVGFRQKFGAIVLAIWRNDHPIRTNLENLTLNEGDLLLLQATHQQIAEIRKDKDLVVGSYRAVDLYQLSERLHYVSIPPGSSLDGKTLLDSHLGDAFGLGVMGIVRDDHTLLMPQASELLHSGDRLLVKGKLEDFETMYGLQALEIDPEAAPTFADMESEQAGMVEVVLSPQTTLQGKTLRQISFREKFGLSVLAIWRGGNPHRFNIRDMKLRFGDELLVFGPREKLGLLGKEHDFLVLTEHVQSPPRSEKAWLATLVMVGVVLAAALRVLPISIAGIVGATLMVLSGSLKMEEAYRAIEWKAIFLIAGMLPLGIAMQNSGAAAFLAEIVVQITGPYGLAVQISGIFLLTALASQIMPNPVVAVLMAPIAVLAAENLGYSPHALMVVIAIAASSSFLTPVGHPSNVLVMGPGGYRFSSYFKAGLPLLLINWLLILLVLPVIWPFVP